MNNGFLRTSGLIFAGVLVSACQSLGHKELPAGPTAMAAGEEPFSNWPCMSYTEACGKIPTRAPVNKELAGSLNGNPARGQEVVLDRSKGNCPACHVMKDGAQPGSRGPDLSKYGTWKKSDAEAYALVFDMRSRNRDALMPPFGTNDILSDQEIRDVVAYLQSSK